MFHCNGWCFPWSLSVIAGTHVCLRWVRAKAMYDAIADHGVTHLSGAPIVMSTLLNATPEEKRPINHRVSVNHAAAPPPQSVLDAMTAAGFHLTHLYGLTETYGPATVNEWNQEWNDLDAEARAFKRTRQGVRYVALEDLTVMDPLTMTPVPADGETIGEVMFRGNIVMKGYLKNPSGQRRGLRRRLVPFRRSRRALSGRLHPAEGSLEGHHHLRAARTSPRSRSRTSSTSTRPSRFAPWSPSQTRSGARRRAPSSSCGRIWRRPQMSYLPGAATGWHATSARATSCLRKCRARRPARFRSSSCARWRRTRNARPRLQARENSSPQHAAEYAASA